MLFLLAALAVCCRCSVVYMGDAWRATLDPRAVFALFLLVEIRYHQLKLPKPPRDTVHDAKGGALVRRGDGVGNSTLGGPTKKAAEFRKISSLTPLCTGVNLRVKVVEPIKPAVRRKKIGESGGRDAGCFRTGHLLQFIAFSS